MSILTIDDGGIPTFLDFFHKLIRKQKEPEEEPETDTIKIYAASQTSKGEIIDIEWDEIE